MTTTTNQATKSDTVDVPSTPPEAHPKASLTEILGELIHTYTRSQAIQDGYLVDVTQTAMEAGFRLPVAITRAAWEDCVEWTEEDSQRQLSQDEAGRLWDVLWIAALAARRNKGERLQFQFYRVPRGGRGVRPRLTGLQLVLGPGDQDEPVITILMPNEC
jgi:hypothetical protein